MIEDVRAPDRRTAFPPETRFCHPWRSYQARILAELEEHLEDGHPHVIAAPGSGKTVLGLEVVRRLDGKTLILAPTLAIRDQWVDRFVGLLLNDELNDGKKETNEHPEWISKDIRQPGFLTVATYQALHMARSADPKRLFPGLRTLVVDEAHHLRSSWWKSLDSFKARAGEITVVALTATPPYDVSVQEWDRYKALCGPVDTEVSVPELVREGSLCPHQDCVWLSSPSDEEHRSIRDFREAISRFVRELGEDESFQVAIAGHPWMRARRCLAFAGVSLEGHVITNGITRLGLGDPPFPPRRIGELNAATEVRALDRSRLEESWEKALQGGERGIMVEELRAPTVPTGFLFDRTIQGLLWQGVFWGLYALSQAAGRAQVPRGVEELLFYVGILVAIPALVALPFFARGLWLLLRNGPVATSMVDIAKALVWSLHRTGAIRTLPRSLEIRVQRGQHGTVYASLGGGTSFERAVFLDALQEIVDPIRNPRYLLIRRSLFGWIRRKDYHAVPRILGTNKEKAETLQMLWRKHVGDAELVYTRAVEGRQLLLEARERSLSAGLQSRAERINSWM